MKADIKRRKLIELMSKGIASSMVLPSIYSNPVLAQTQAAADQRKILFIYASAGATTRFIDMRPSWHSQASKDNYSLYRNSNQRTPDNADWEFSFTDSQLTEAQMSRVLKPFWRHRDRMTFLEGVDMTSTGFDNTADIGDGHARAHIGAMNGTKAAYSTDGVKSVPVAPSIDQRINDFIKQNRDPQHRTLSYRLNTGGGIFHEFLYYDPKDGSGQMKRVPVETNPVSAFNALVGNIDSAPTDGLSQRNGDIFQLLNGQYTSLANRLSGADRQKLEAHRSLINDLESRVSSVLSCSSQQPSSSERNGLSKVERQYWDLDMFARLVAMAFSCGDFRIASIGIDDIPTETYGLPAGISIHHEYEHNTDPELYFNNYEKDPNSDAAQLFFSREEAMVKRNVWQAERVAEIVDVFASTPDRNGEGSLLDSTVIVYVNEMAHGVHGHDHWPITLFGNFNNAISDGRYIKYANNHYQVRPNYSHWAYKGIAQTKFFVFLCQQMGMEIDYLLEPRIASAWPAPEGRWTDLSGPLPRLKL